MPPSHSELDLYDIDFRVTVRAYSEDDAVHLAMMYKDRIASLAPAWPVKQLGLRPSERQAI